MPVMYGFQNLTNLFDRRVNTVGWDVVGRAVDASVAEHNRQMGAMLDLFATRTTDFKKRFTTPTAARLQPLDGNGRARPIRPAGHYDVAFPLQMAGAAWGANFLARAEMTVQEANEATQTLISADYRWVRDHVLAALYANTSWSYDNQEDQAGALTIKGLANSDSDTYLIQTGADTGATDTHYLAQAAAIADASNPYPTLRDELVEHPENAGEVIALIPSNLKATTVALATFMEKADPNIRPGASASVLTGNLGLNVPGQVLGYESNGVWIVEWKALPNDYIIGITTGGERPLAMREKTAAELRGFVRAADRPDYPWYESQFFRIAGFGAWNRVGAVVYRVGNGSYAVPTNYTSPLA